MHLHFSCACRRQLAFSNKNFTHNPTGHTALDNISSKDWIFFRNSTLRESREYIEDREIAAQRAQQRWENVAPTSMQGKFYWLSTFMKSKISCSTAYAS